MPDKTIGELPPEMTIMRKDVRMIDRLAQRHRSFTSPPWREAWQAAGVEPPMNGPAAREAVAGFAGPKVRALDFTGAPDDLDVSAGVVPYLASDEIFWPHSADGNKQIFWATSGTMFSFIDGNGSWADQYWLDAGSNVAMPLTGQIDLKAGEVIVMEHSSAPVGIINSNTQRIAIAARMTEFAAQLGGAISFKYDYNEDVTFYQDNELIIDENDVVAWQQGTDLAYATPAPNMNVVVLACPSEYSGDTLVLSLRENEEYGHTASEPHGAGQNSFIRVTFTGPLVVNVERLMMGLAAITAT